MSRHSCLARLAAGVGGVGALGAGGRRVVVLGNVLVAVLSVGGQIDVVGDVLLVVVGIEFAGIGVL
ncbi:hypothetical protein [Mycobacterium sp. shizuoka-1]|uniref:hypothetical protein n=1 Tax=Mycobacterium sp. shizuoka-1 TaxID=2039281 RepID=UPI001157F557|nr:hypothetical protein [Mycobacterium sp. shizuoka-1]